MTATAPQQQRPPRPDRPVPPGPGPRGDGKRLLPLLSPPLARLLCVTALGLWAAIRWGTLLEPTGAGRMILLLVIALATGLAVAQLSRLPASAQAPAAVLVVLGWAATSVAAAGAPVSVVIDPARWDELASGLQHGIDELPQLLVPYDGADRWPRVAILLGGSLLLALGCVLALTPGRHGTPLRSRAPFGGGILLRLMAAVPLLAAAIVPTAIMSPAAPVWEGLLLFVLLVALLWLEELPRVQLPGAVALVAIAAAGGALAPAALDRDQPWFDVQRLVNGLDQPAAARFDWSQRYGPLDWPRDGREVLRVRSSVRSYWKARNLDGFDGIRWRTLAPPTPTQPQAELPPAAFARRDWRHPVEVRIGAFSTTDVIGAGTTLGFSGDAASFLPASSPGTWVAADALKPGATYVADTIIPRPSRAQLAAAGATYPQILDRYRDVGLPQRDLAGRLAGGATAALIPAFGTTPSDAQRQQLAASPYADTYALARRLADGAATPYALVRDVLAYLRDGYTYSETPPRRQLPLEAFLFRDRAGYCQQFAGAAALLLRMGGVPARVVTGFTTGSRVSDPRGAISEYVVRDYDAHAWIEVWFPQVGWVQFDPTPTTAPARSGGRGVTPGTTPAAQTPPRRTAPDQPAATRAQQRQQQDGAAGQTGDGGGSFPVVLALVLAGLAGAAAVALRRLLRPVRGTDALLAELERALRRTGRPPEPRVTLLQLEERLHDAPDAAAYVRAIRLARFGEEGEAVVTAHQRRALRAELARNLGAAGRLRALLALPPRLGR